MPQVRTLTTTVAGAQFKQQHLAIEEFWRRMEAANGGRPGDPRDYISLVNVEWDPGRGWIIEYEVPTELLEQKEVHVIMEEPEINGQGVPEQAGSADASSVLHTTQPMEIMPSLIQVTGHNPRKTFDPAQLAELRASIMEHGIIEPLIVRPKGSSRYELVVGERRLRAARELCLEHVPVVVRQLTDEQMLDIMLAENLQRVDLNPIEEAHHLKRVLEIGKLTQTELGRRIGKSQEWVSQRLRLAEAPGVLQDMIISRLISPWSAIEVLAWKNTEHYDSIMHEIGAWSVEGEELPRARVREIIKEITEPVVERQPHEQGPSLGTISSTVDGDQSAKDPTCVDCGNSTWSKGELVCAHHGPVHPKGRYCEKFVAPSLGGDDDPVDDEEDGCEMFGEPGAADDEVCAVDCPDYDECKSEGGAEEDDDEDLPDETVNDGLMVTERPEDFRSNKGVPEIVDKHSSHGYHGRLIGSSNGDLQVETGERKKPHYEDLGVIVAKAIGCVEGDKVPIAVDITRGAITIRRRGKF